MSLPLEGQRCRVRPWAPADLDALVQHADNPRVSAQLRDVFPYPYTLDDGRRFLAFVAPQHPPTSMAIEVDGAAVGGVGVVPAIARRVARGHGGDVKLLEGASVEGMYLAGAVFSLTVQKRAPMALPDA